MAVVFEIKGRELVFSDEQASYNRLRLHFSKLAHNCAQKYIESCYRGYSGIDEFAKSGLQDGFGVINEAVEDAVRILINAKVYDIDAERFWDTYGSQCFSPWAEAFESINDQYMEIVLDSRELDAYRTARRLNRGKVIGGGFGLQGAVKGMMTAGALNAATNVLHGTVNVIGKGISMIGDSINKSRLYNSDSTQATLRAGIRDSVFNIHYALCRRFRIPGVDEAAAQSADAVFNNLAKLPDDQRATKILDVIRTNPYRLKYYSYFFTEFGDEAGELEKIADYFGVDLRGRKEEAVRQVYRELKIASEEDALEAKERIARTMAIIGMRESKAMDEINQKLIDFDTQARTVDGILFGTREQASAARVEFEAIEAILERNKTDTYLGAKNAAEEIASAGFQTSIAEKYAKQMAEAMEKRLGELQEYEKQYGQKSKPVRFFKALFEMIIYLSLAALAFPRWGIIGKVLGVLLLLASLGSVLQRRDSAKELREIEKAKQA